MRAAFMMLLLALAGGRAEAQLISPGKLSNAHSGFEGLRSCTSCHDLGKKGASSAKCLACHAPLKTRIEKKSGFHASQRGQECTTCHKEHFGRDFDVVHLDAAAFDHKATGYTLEAAHERVKCDACHTPANIKAPDVRAWTRDHKTSLNTMLGLSAECATCHSDDDPHGGQFRESCRSCHEATAWERPARFDHGRTRYRLTGAHRKASCDGCHKSASVNGRSIPRYSGTPTGECSTCHAEPHNGSMGRSCTTCHDTNGWTSVDAKAVAGRFDHSRTRFELRGAHLTASCMTCHSPDPLRRDFVIRIQASTRNASYPRPGFGSCVACHADFHEGAFAETAPAASCDGCHSEKGWSPAGYDIERHNRAGAFTLTGTHLVVPCTSCHGTDGKGRPQFRIVEHECVACHREASPHGGQFDGRSCAECHSTTSFRVDAFDHAKVAGATCRSCHESGQPHGDQFGETGCQVCHTTTTYRIEKFDHSRARFVLDGAHARVACASCHKPGPAASGTVVYRPLSVECSACHGGVT